VGRIVALRLSKQQQKRRRRIPPPGSRRFLFSSSTTHHPFILAISQVGFRRISLLLLLPHRPSDPKGFSEFATGTHSGVKCRPGLNASPPYWGVGDEWILRLYYMIPLIELALIMSRYSSGINNCIVQRDTITNKSSVLYLLLLTSCWTACGPTELPSLTRTAVAGRRQFSSIQKGKRLPITIHFRSPSFPE
jgi:hypothetical protein